MFSFGEMMAFIHMSQFMSEMLAGMDWTEPGESKPDEGVGETVPKEG